MVTGIEVLAGLLSVLAVGVMALTEDRALRADLLIVAVALALISASFQGLKENQKARHRRTLGNYLLVGQALTRLCRDLTKDWTTTKGEVDKWGEQALAHIAKHFGDGAAVLFNSSDGLPLLTIVRLEGDEGRERNNYESWLRFRCARLAELIGRLS